jgi:hypothetical protein
MNQEDIEQAGEHLITSKCFFGETLLTYSARFRASRMEFNVTAVREAGQRQNVFKLFFDAWGWATAVSSLCSGFEIADPVCSTSSQPPSSTMLPWVQSAALYDRTRHRNISGNLQVAACERTVNCPWRLSVIPLFIHHKSYIQVDPTSLGVR